MGVFFLADHLNSVMGMTVGALRLRILAEGGWRVFSMSSSSTFESLSWSCSTVLLLELLLGSKGPKGATCTSVCYLYIGSGRLELKA